ncbi:unnamed protein product [Heterobilharzia americana]|nr:unnamed protein product [Heterobilharzia americana]
MSAEVDDEFEVPSVPAPFKGLEKDRIETRKRQALFLRQSLRIVERFAHNPVSVAMLACALPWLEREQYDDIAVERNAYGNCGYALCCNSRSETTSKQQYRICTATRRVYDITKRRPFCSDWYSLKPCRIDLLPPNASGHVGKVILDVRNRLRLTGSESDSSIENELNSNDELDLVEYSNAIPDHSCMQLEMNSEGELPAFDIHPRTVDTIKSKAASHDSETKTSNTSSSDAKQILVGNDIDNENDTSDMLVSVSDRLLKRLRDWMTEKALSVLTTYSFTSEQQPVNKMHSKVLQQFYSKYGSSKKEKSQDETQCSDIPLTTCVLPLIDSVSPQVLRRQIFLDDVKRSMHRILDVLQVNPYPVYRRLENAVLHFNLTNKNLHMKPSERQLVALVSYVSWQM